ncbi:glycosyltransferase family 2 protein [Pseudalkalibacillus sp. Hm43]|uniref:glycosyltransferase family 2 protein n=1 Tax=Pseudalkalibacillus sp. Hm43 TaxID=3450742 RepID=UPI003F42B8B3
MRVSVVMAVYNSELYLQEAIESILQQTYQHFEFIIVNDGSTDRTKQILDQVRNQKVEVIHLDCNGGAANALNHGIQVASGDWIAIQDADDLSHPTRLEEQVQYVQEHPDLVAVGTLKKCISGKIPVEEKRLKREEHSNFLMDEEQMKRYRFYINPLCHGSMLFSRTAFYKAGKYDPTFRVCYDYDLWMRMFEFGEIHKLPKHLYHYRIHAESLSNGNDGQINEDWVVATKYIHNIVSKEVGHRPFISVLGNSQACKEFERLAEKCDLNVNRYIHSPQPDEAQMIHNSFLSGKTDAVILLEGIQYLALFQELQNKGMVWNASLFKIWAGYL